MFVQVVTVEPGILSHLLLHHPHCPGLGEYLLCKNSSVRCEWMVSTTVVGGPTWNPQRGPACKPGGKWVLFCYFHPEEHTCPSTDMGVPHITIGVFLKDVEMKPHCPVLLYPYGMLQVGLGVPC